MVGSLLRNLARSVRLAVLPSALIAGMSTESLAQRPGQPTVQDMLALRPTQRFVDYDSPSADQIAALKADLVTEGKAKIWVLRDSGGRLYRRFVDSDRDGVVDQWVYYRDGLEVYRDIDSNSNRLADQFRWLNTGGTRWAVDANEDGKIDGYRVISVEEATREWLRGLMTKEFGVVEPLMARPAEASILAKLITPDRLKDLTAKSKEQFTQLANQANHLSAETQWVRMESQVPMLIAGDAPDGSRDIELYRGVKAVVQTGSRTDMLQFGDIVLFGRAAKLLDVPTLSAVKAPTLAQAPVVFNNVPPEAAVEGPADTGDKEQQELMLQLQKLDEQMGKVGSNEVASVRYQLQRAEVMEKLAERAKTDEDRIEWLRQQADCLIGAIQMSGAKEPQERLAKFLESLRGADQGSSLAGYVAFRQISANYFRKLQAAGSDFTAVQKEWLEDLEKFVSDYPDGEDTADALSQLAIGLEFTGKEDAACERYQRIVDAFPKSGVAARARGAIERLGLVGKPFKLRAPDIRRGTVDVDRLAGKVVLIDYWATTCDPWKSELARLKEIYNKYKGKGFEIIGVSLDSDKAEVMKYVQSAGIPWPVVYEPGGLDSTLALQYGILALPTQFLVDAKGQVVSRTVHITMLEDELTKLLAK